MRLDYFFANDLFILIKPGLRVDYMLLLLRWLSREIRLFTFLIF